MLLLGGVTLAGAFLMVHFWRWLFSLTFQGRVGLRAFQRFQSFSKLPRGVRSLSKGGFEQKMTRREAAQIVGVKYYLAWLELITANDTWRELNSLNDIRMLCWRIILIVAGHRIWLWRLMRREECWHLSQDKMHCRWTRMVGRWFGKRIHGVMAPLMHIPYYLE